MSADAKGASAHLTEGRYRTIVADPPWRISAFTNGSWVAQALNEPVAAPYAFMELPQICGLPVRDWAERNAVLFLWTINAYVPEAYEVAWAWGFRPSKLLTWCKAPVGVGPGGTFVTTTEFVLFATRGRVGAKQRVPSSWFQWPRGAHSQKPEAFLDLVESVFDGPYLEMFARRNRLGWDTWGNEALNHVDIEGAA